jgi:hypothetical protein
MVTTKDSNWNKYKYFFDNSFYGRNNPYGTEWTRVMFKFGAPLNGYKSKTDNKDDQNKKFLDFAILFQDYIEDTLNHNYDGMNIDYFNNDLLSKLASE